MDGRADLVERFQMEAETIARLQHPNIVQIFEVGEFDGKPFFSMEYVSGGTLANLLAKEPQSTIFSAGLMRSLAIAMQETHRHKIVHRDLKPHNILLLEAPAQTTGVHAIRTGTPLALVPKISDFGLAKLLDETGNATVSGALIGTPNYMAPE